jgi:hypothetical protein
MPYLSFSALLNPENDTVFNPPLDYHPPDVSQAVGQLIGPAGPLFVHPQGMSLRCNPSQSRVSTDNPNYYRDFYHSLFELNIQCNIRFATGRNITNSTYSSAQCISQLQDNPCNAISLSSRYIS